MHPIHPPPEEGDSEGYIRAGQSHWLLDLAASSADLAFFNWLFSEPPRGRQVQGFPDLCTVPLCSL